MLDTGFDVAGPAVYQAQEVQKIWRGLRPGESFRQGSGAAEIAALERFDSLLKIAPSAHPALSAAKCGTVN